MRLTISFRALDPTLCSRTAAVAGVTTAPAHCYTLLVATQNTMSITDESRVWSQVVKDNDIRVE